MARKEAELALQGVRFINQSLEEYMPGRTLEAIKGYRRKESYKILVRQYITELEDIPGPAPRALVPQPQRDVDIPEPVDPIEDLDPAEDLEPARSPVPGSDPHRGSGPVPGSGIRSRNLEQINEERNLVNLMQRIGNELAVIPEEHGEKYFADELQQIAKEVQAGAPRDEVLQSITMYLLKILPFREHVGTSETGTTSGTRLNSRKRRRLEYSITQKQWKKNPGKYLRSLLKDIKTVQLPPANRMFPFWEEMFTTENNSTPGRKERVQPATELWRPILADEIKNAFPDMGTAPGPDGLMVSNFRKLPATMIQRIFLIFQYCGRVPTYLLKSRTTMIPKKSGPVEPKDFRPITVSSVLIRTFHKVLANRLQKLVKIDHRQRAFRDFDGVAGSTFILDIVIRHQRKSLKPLYLAFIDVAKAFDTVTHNTIADILYNKGVPKPFIDYIQDVYSRSRTTLSVGGQRSREIHPNRGVKQGDPLSPLVFNYIMDGLLQTMPDHIGVRVGGKVVNALAFADDLVLVATTPTGLQTILDQATTYLLKCGLSINTGKSMSVAMKTVPGEKKTVIDKTSKFICNGRQLKALTREDGWRYLGVPFTPEGYATPNVTTELRESIETLTRAPLKPQQRLFALRVMVLPSVYHSLVLGRTTLSLLNKADKMVRTAVRKWVALPHDIPNAYIHASGIDGGLGIPSLRWEVPIRRLGRLQAVSQMDEIRENQTMLTFLKLEITRTAARLSDPILNVKSRAEMRKRWALLLHASVDGKALKESAKVPQQNQWVTEGTRFLSGRDFVHMCKLRINALPVRSRTTRGRAQDRACRGGCAYPETMHHILQQCHRTHDARIKRHDAIVQYIKRYLELKKYRIDVEPKIHTEEGNRKPDIIAVKDRTAYVIDAQVVSEQSDLNRRHKEKTKYYSNNESLTQNIKSTYLVQEVAFSSVTLSARGVWSAHSAGDLKRKGLIRTSDLKVISTRAIIGGIAAFRTFMERTDVYGRRRRAGVG